MRRFISHVDSVLLALSLLVSARTSAAQVATSYEMGWPGVPVLDRMSPAVVLFGVRIASIKPLVPGVDFQFVVPPVLLANGLLLVGLGLDVTYPLPIGRSAIISPRAGASSLLGGVLAEYDGLTIATGYNVGVGLVAGMDAKTAIRVDVGRHWFPEGLGGFVVTMGVVRMP